VVIFPVSPTGQKPAVSAPAALISVQKRVAPNSSENRNLRANSKRSDRSDRQRKDFYENGNYLACHVGVHSVCSRNGRKAKWAGSSTFKINRLQKLLPDHARSLTLDAATRDRLAADCWDPAYGARPLSSDSASRARPLAEMILYGEVRDGDEIAISSFFAAC
jgi:C-terminal, D2-small domain, of ClpB protein